MSKQSTSQLFVVKGFAVIVFITGIYFFVAYRAGVFEKEAYIEDEEPEDVIKRVEIFYPKEYISTSKSIQIVRKPHPMFRDKMRRLQIIKETREQLRKALEEEERRKKIKATRK